jgi:glutamate dehydrogenase (NAD(P)+)
LELGGSIGRFEATGLGCFFATKRFLEIAPLPGLEKIESATVVVQGFGNVGSIAAKSFREAGAVVLAVSDSEGGVYNESGLDLEAIIANKTEHGTVVGTPGTRTITNEELLGLECDILIPAALGDQICRDNAAGVNAKLVVEAANRPVTPAADEILVQNGVVVLPDIVANAGGVTVSYMEWVQNIENEEWSLERINAELERKITDAVDAVVGCWRGLNASDRAAVVENVDETRKDHAKELLADLRTAALVVAIRRVARATLKRGIWP